MGGLQAPELVEQRVVDVVADFGIIEHVVAVAMVFELAAQLGEPLVHVRKRLPLARGLTSR